MGEAGGVVQNFGALLPFRKVREGSRGFETFQKVKAAPHLAKVLRLPRNLVPRLPRNLYLA